MQFLAKVITGVVRTYLECGAPETLEDSTMPSANEQSQASHWITKAFMLGELWNIDGDRLKRIYICELYSSALDQQAERVTYCKTLNMAFGVHSDAGKSLNMVLQEHGKLFVPDILPLLCYGLQCLKNLLDNSFFHRESKQNTQMEKIANEVISSKITYPF